MELPEQKVPGFLYRSTLRMGPEGMRLQDVFHREAAEPLARAGLEIMLRRMTLKQSQIQLAKQLEARGQHQDVVDTRQPVDP